MRINNNKPLRLFFVTLYLWRGKKASVNQLPLQQSQICNLVVQLLDRKSQLLIILQCSHSIRRQEESAHRFSSIAQQPSMSSPTSLHFEHEPRHAPMQHHFRMLNLHIFLVPRQQRHFQRISFFRQLRVALLEQHVHILKNLPANLSRRLLLHPHQVCALFSIFRRLKLLLHFGQYSIEIRQFVMIQYKFSICCHAFLCPQINTKLFRTFIALDLNFLIDIKRQHERNEAKTHGRIFPLACRTFHQSLKSVNQLLRFLSRQSSLLNKSQQSLVKVSKLLINQFSALLLDLFFAKFNYFIRSFDFYLALHPSAIRYRNANIVGNQNGLLHFLVNLGNQFVISCLRKDVRSHLHS